MDPERQQLTFQRATSLLQNGDAESAERMCRSALLEFPQDPNLMCLSGRALIMLGKYAEAEERINTAITMFPEFSRPHVVRGELRLIQGRHDQAVDEFQRAVELGDSDPTTQIKLSRALTLKGDQVAAKVAVEHSLRLDPTRRKLAEAFEMEKTGKQKEAEEIYRDILKHDPENVDALRLLAGLATSQNKHRDAEILLKRALELTPDYGKAMADLVVNQVEQEKIDNALQYAARLTRIAGDNPDSYLLQGNAYSAAGRYDDAINAYQTALKLAPEHPGALSGLAHNLKTIGKQDEAIATYRQCIAVNPYFTESYWSLANLKTFRFSDDEVESMEKLLEHPHIPDAARIHLGNALGLQYEYQKDYDRAFSYFEICNATKRKLEYYDSVETEFLHDRIIEVFDQEFVNRTPADTKSDATPIFIIGLPRSGSTLLEQILASHSQVEGTMELPDIISITRRLSGKKSSADESRYPDVLSELTAEQLSEFGDEYIERTRIHRSGAPFFIDKMPNNFPHIGLIHLILPNAKIIDARRHPLGCCFSGFKQLFAAGQNFSYDLTDIGQYYRDYVELMNHWNRILPGRVLRMQYESVVADTETQVRQLLDYCGLPFEDACLRFYETKRAVRTASSEQVRQPIYSAAVEQWRHYLPHLDPLIEALGAAMDGYTNDLAQDK